MASVLEGVLQYSFFIDILLHNCIGTYNFEPESIEHLTIHQILSMALIQNKTSKFTLDTSSQTR